MSKILLATAVLVALYNLFFFHTSFGLGTGLIFLILNLFFYLTRENSEPKNRQLGLLSSSLSVIFGFLIAWRDNGYVLLINLLASIFFLLSATYFYKGRSLFRYSLPSFLITPLALLTAALAAPFVDQDQKKEPGSNSEVAVSSFVIKGVMIAVPIFGVLLLLLTQADPVFQKFTADLLKDIGERVVISAILFATLFVFALSKIVQRREELESQELIHQGKAYELSIILGSISILFALFILVQFQYLFSNLGERELAKLGIASLTYSEYVRKGFAELLVVSVISISVLIYALRYLHRLPLNHKMLLQVLSSVMAIETGLILLSAAQRDILYAAAHGLTRARIFGFIFLAWLALLIVLFLIKIALDLKRKQFFYANLSLITVAILAVSLVNIDGLIATDFRPTVNKEVDYPYLASISTDAYPAWKDAIMTANNLVASLEGDKEVTTDQDRQLFNAEKSLSVLNYRLNFLTDKYAPYEAVVEKYRQQNQKVPDWVGDVRNLQSFNFSQLEAYQYILQNQTLFQQMPKLQDRIKYFRAVYNHTTSLPRPNVSSGSANFRPSLSR